jgi:tape measure domain-containing protein
MSDYKLRFIAETSSAGRSIREIKQSIKEVSQAFENAKVGSRDFYDNAARLGLLKSSLSQVKSAVVDLDREYKRLDQSLKSAFQDQEKLFASQQSATGGLISQVGKLAAAYFTIQTAQKAFQSGIQRVESERRIRALSGAFGEVAETQEAAARAAQRFGLSQTEANQAFAQIYARLRPIGISLAEIESSFNGFNTAAKLSGATIQEASSAWLQLSQALGSGVLRGEELNSVFEQTPAVVQAIAKEMNVPIGQIRDLAKDGEITSDIVIRALKRIETEGADQLAEAMQGPAQQIKNLQNEFENLQVAATKDLIPSIINIVKELRDVLESLGPVIRGLGSLAAQSLGGIADLINLATKPKEAAARISIRGGRLPDIGGAADLFKGTSGAGGVGLKGIIEEAKELSRLRRQPFNQVVLELMQNRLERLEAPTAPARPVPSTLPSGTPPPSKPDKKSKSAADRAAREAARAALEAQRLQAIERQLNEELRIRLKTLQIDQNIAAARADQNDEKIAEFESDKRILELGVRRAKIQKDFDAGRIKASEYKLRLQLLEIDEIEEQQKHEENLNKILKERFGITDAIAKAARQAREATFGAEGAAGTFRTDIDLIPGLTKGALGERMEAVKEELSKLLDPATQLIEAADNIGRAFGEAFKGMVNGSMTAQQALASFFQSVGDYFLDMASRMIAKWIEMQVIGLVQSLFPGSSSIFPKGAPDFSNAFGPGGPTFQPSAFAANGAVWQGGFQAFANGGIVKGPTLGLVGEGRYNEAIVPLPDGRSIPVDLGNAAGNQIVSNITVNVSNGQAQSNANGSNSSELGRKLEGAVKQVIVGELRPGGLLGGRR